MSNYDELFERAHHRATTGQGGLSTEELAAVVAQIQARNSGNMVLLLRILGYAGASAVTSYEELMASFLTGPDDGLAWTALWILCMYWDRTAHYVPQMLEFIRGVPWDEGMLQGAAIHLAGWHLRTNSEPRLLRELICLY